MKYTIQKDKMCIRDRDYVEAQIDLSEHHIMILEQFVPWKGTLLKSESNKVNDIYLTAVSYTHLDVYKRQP